MRTGITFTVSADDRQRLQAIVAAPASPQKHVWRALIAASMEAGKLAIDVNHAIDIAGGRVDRRDRGAGGAIRARVEWTPKGRDLIEERAYRGISLVSLMWQMSDTSFFITGGGQEVTIRGDNQWGRGFPPNFAVPGGLGPLVIAQGAGRRSRTPSCRATTMRPSSPNSPRSGTRPAAGCKTSS